MSMKYLILSPNVLPMGKENNNPVQVMPGQTATSIDAILKSSPLHPKSKTIIVYHYDPKTGKKTMTYVPPDKPEKASEALGKVRGIIESNSGSSPVYVFAKTMNGLPEGLTDMFKGAGEIIDMTGYSTVEVDVGTDKFIRYPRHEY